MGPLSLVPPGKPRLRRVIIYQLIEKDFNILPGNAPTDEVQLNTSPGPWIYVRTLLECQKLGKEPETFNLKPFLRKIMNMTLEVFNRNLQKKKFTKC